MISEEKLEQIPSKKLAKIILAVHMRNKNIRKEIEMLIAANSSDKQEVISLIKNMISTISKYKSSRSDTTDETLVLLDMVSDALYNLSDFAPREAFDLMVKLLGLHANLRQRCSGDKIIEAINEMSLVLIKIAKRADVSVNELIDMVFNLFASCSKSHRQIIRNFSDILKVKGLQQLKMKFIAYANDDNVLAKKVEEIKNVEKRGYGPYTDFYFVNLGKEQGFNISVTKEGLYTKSPSDVAMKEIYGTTRFALKEIADCLDDVDEYIKACTFPDQKYSYTAKDIVNYEKIEIAFRLINKKRFADALKWLSKLDSKNMQLEVFHRLKISALEGLGEYQEVQKIRVALFRKTLDPEIFREIRKYSGDNFAQSLVKEILKVIYNGEAGISVCNFLVQEGFLEECSNFVESHMKKIGDQDYKEIHPIAEALQEKFPLVAILLYRKMIKNVLYYGLHSYYSKIIKDLETCTELDKRIIPVDKKYMRQSAWVREIRDDYARREDSFWSKYDDFLEEGVIRKRVRRGY